MKKLLLVSLLCGISCSAMAEQTISIAYSQGKISNGETLRGANIKYRNEFNNQWGWLASVSYMKANKSGLSDETIIAPDILGNGQRDTKYYSIMAGPSYRFNEIISVYGMLGMAHTKAKGSADWLNHENGHYVKRGSESTSQSKTTIGYGIGVQINPVKNIAIDIAYEGAQSSNLIDNKVMNAFTIGLGYKF